MSTVPVTECPDGTSTCHVWKPSPAIVNRPDVGTGVGAPPSTEKVAVALASTAISTGAP